MNEMPLGMSVPAPLGRQPLVVAGRLDDHLAAHEHQHRREAVVEEPEQVHDAGQQEVEGPQAENREHVRREGDEPHVVGAGRDHAQDCRHAVDREQHVGALHDQQHQEQRRGQEFAVLPNEEPVARLLLGDRDEAAEEPDHAVLPRLVVAAAESELDARVDEKATEQPHHPLVALDEFGPEEHERQPHDHGAEDAPEKHAVLVLQRHAKVGEDHGEHEDVVHRQRPFDEVAGEELDRRLAPQPPPDEAVEGERQGRPEDRPEGALAEGGLVRLLVEDGEVEHQHYGHEDREGDPVRHLDFTASRGRNDVCKEVHGGWSEWWEGGGRWQRREPARSQEWYQLGPADDVRTPPVLGRKTKCSPTNRLARIEKMGRQGRREGNGAPKIADEAPPSRIFGRGGVRHATGALGSSCRGWWTPRTARGVADLRHGSLGCGDHPSLSRGTAVFPRPTGHGWRSLFPGDQFPRGGPLVPTAFTKLIVIAANTGAMPSHSRSSA